MGQRFGAAIEAGDVAAVAALLDTAPEAVAAAVELDGRTRPSDAPGMTPLHLAVAAGQLAVARLLVARGAPLEARNGVGRTALHDCFELGRDELGRDLIAAGAPLDACAAAAFEHARLRELLAAAPTAALDTTTGLTPLEWAAYAGDLAAAAILVDAGARVDAAWGPPSHTGNVPFLRFLLARGGDPDTVDEDGDTPLHRLVKSRLVRDPAPAVRVLLGGGADPRRRNHAGRTARDEALAQAGARAETYFPRRELGEKRLDETIALLS